MDFHSLTRKELQALCKKNKIPANMTNVAMADALQSLDFVDGIEEVLKTCESDVANSSMESPGKSEAVSSVPRTSRRTTQRKTIKHDSETLQTSTKSHCRTRGTVARDVDEARNDVHETPALPTTRRRAATTSVRAKLDSVMKECEPKEKIEDQAEEEKKKNFPKTPAASRASQRKEVKAKSSVRQVYSTRQSVRLAGKPMQEESSTQEDENSGILTFDAVSEETDESLEVNSHKTEELTKNGVDLQSLESLDIKNESDTVLGQDLSTLVQNEVDMEDGVEQDSGNDLVVVASDTKAKEGSEEGALRDNNNGSEEVSGEEPVEEFEIDAEATKEEYFQNMDDNTRSNSDDADVVLTKLHFVAENDDGEEEDNSNQMFECQVDEGAECDSDVAGKQELIGEPLSVNPDTNIDFDEVYLVGQSSSEMEAKGGASQQKCLTNMQANTENDEVEAKVGDSQHKCLPDTENDEVETKVGGSQHTCLPDTENAVEEELMGEYEDAESLEVDGEEEPMEEYEVDYTEVKVAAQADFLKVAGEEEAMEEYDVDCTEAKVAALADSLEVTGEEEATEEYDVDCTEAKVAAQADSLEVTGEEEAKEEYDVDCTEGKVADSLEVTGEEEAKEEYDVDCTEGKVAAQADSLEVTGEEEATEEYDVDCTEAKVAAQADSLEVTGEEEATEEYDVDNTDANAAAPADAVEVAGEEQPTEQSEVDYAEAIVESAVHSFQCLHFSETTTEVAGEEPMGECEIDHAEDSVETAHALPPPASVIPNAAQEPVFTSALDPTQNPSALASTNPEPITQAPLENSSAATNIGQMVVSDNKENLVCTKQNKGTVGNNNQQSLENLSLRKLTKMLKELKISKHSGKEVRTTFFFIRVLLVIVDVQMWSILKCSFTCTGSNLKISLAKTSRKPFDQRKQKLKLILGAAHSACH
ncbi:hypothetical protein P3S67_003674 [Capsicum chacoense]